MILKQILKGVRRLLPRRGRILMSKSKPGGRTENETRPGLAIEGHITPSAEIEILSRCPSGEIV